MAKKTKAELQDDAQKAVDAAEKARKHEPGSDSTTALAAAKLVQKAVNKLPED